MNTSSDGHAHVLLIDEVSALRAQLKELRMVMNHQFHQLHSLGRNSIVDPLVRELDTARSISGIQRLPVELLIKIFTLVVGSPQSQTSSDNIKAGCDEAIALSHVCSGWRDVAIDMPQLWCNMHSAIKLSGLKTILLRSKSRPLNILRTMADASFLDSGKLRLHTMYTINSAHRWKTMIWTSSEKDIRIIVSQLNSAVGLSFPRLCTLQLAVQHRSSCFPLPTFAEDIHIPKFPALEHIRLACISPEELPPSALPALQTFYLFYSPKRFSASGQNQAPPLRMSTLLPLLFRAPGLTELTLDETVPLLDIELGPLNDTLSNPVKAYSRRTCRVVQPLKMSKLTSFSWYQCPAKDLWRFFHFVSMPALRTLHLFIDLSASRWPREHDGVILFMDSAIPVSRFHTDPLIRMDALTDLTLEFSDSDGLTAALRKFILPSLKSLSLMFVPTKDLATLPELPISESIFRDPPMPHLTTLCLSRLRLHLEHTTSLLRYTPLLQSLTLEGCSGAGELVHSLRGKISTYGSVIVKQWDCLHLEHLAFMDCADLEFDQLAQMVLSRKKGAEGKSEADTAGSPARPCKPLKRRALTSNGSSSSLPALSRSPPRIKPLSIKSVRVEACDGILEFDLHCLVRGSFGVEDIHWEP
ncbi:unnamed protein product [Somion occarium]|uniref:F-box domain-containing protein n=1 Tax=Somion occarium TaxID=3059160 RepID=A0ABP1D0M3_9APHY